MDISVIVPHLNQSAALGRLLKSLDVQSTSGIVFEVIIADNGSTSPLPDAVHSHPRVTVVHESSPGPGPARNRGVAAARGHILAFIDADCTAHPNWIRTIGRHFLAADAAPVIGGDVRIAPRGSRLGPIEAYESVFGYRFELYIRRDHYAGTGNLAMRREVFDTVGPFGGIQIAEDRDWGQRAAHLGFAPAYVHEMIVYTEARANFGELARKWDRHIAHDFARLRTLRNKVTWVARAFAIAASPVGEIPRVLRSPRISGSKARLLAWGVMGRIRIYRSRRMLQLISGRSRKDMVLGWHKK